MNLEQTITIIGAGRLGRTLGRLLSGGGYSILGISCATMASAQQAASFIGGGTACERIPEHALLGDVIFITTPDDQIGDVAADLAESRDHALKGRVVFHCSGALASTVLAPLQMRGAAIGALHPMQSFADPEEAMERVKESFFCLEGDAKAVEAGEQLVQRLQGRLLVIPLEKKALYHLACVTASNFLVTLIGLGVDLFEQAGLPKEKGVPALLPLIRGTLENIQAMGVEKALTGPFARGDAETIQRHGEALRSLAPEHWAVYASLALRTVDVAEESGQLSASAAKRIREFLKQKGIRDA